MTHPETVGLIGMGLMGSAFADNLRRAGFMVRGFDLDPARMDAHVARGGEIAESPADVARGLRHVVMSLPDSAASRAAALGPGGVAEADSDDLVILDATTPSPEEVEALGRDLAAQGITFLDTCVSGTSAMAQRKDLIVIAGGDAGAFESARHVIDGFSRAAYLLGPVGSGARMKLVIAVVLVGTRAALAEALVLAEKSGMDPSSALDVLIDSAAYAKTMVDKGPKMVNGDYTPEGQIKSGFKNSGLIVEQARRFGAPTLVAGVIAEVMQAAMVAGYADADSAAMVEVFRSLAGLDRRPPTAH